MAKLESGPSSKDEADAGPAAEAAQGSVTRSTRVGPKHVAIAVGALAFAVGGLVFALEGSQPDFICKLNGECGKHGRCVGLRFACSVGTSAGCRASEDCRREGLCSAGGGACVAAVDDDCSSSETCRANARCVQFDGACVPEAQRSAVRTAAARDEAMKAVTDYLKLVEVGARGGNTSIAIASFFAASQVEGFQVESPEPRLEAAEWGTATFNGRTLPAAVTRATFAEVDRSAGKRRRSCIVSAAINDKEFGMWRGLQAWSCTNSKLSENLSGWRTDNAFQMKGSFSESPAAALREPAASPSSASAARSAVAPPPPSLPLTVVARDQNRPVAAAIAGGVILWANHGVDASGKEKPGLGSVQKAPLGGGDVVSVAAKLDGPMNLVTDATHVYWTELAGVKRAPLAGGSTSGVVYIGEGKGVPSSLALDSDAVLIGIMHMTNGGLFKAPKKGGVLQEVNGGLVVADAVATDGESTYVCINGDVLGRIPKGGNASNASLLAKGLKGCAGIAVGDDSVYVTESKAGTLSRLPKAGGEPSPLARDLGEPHDVVVDGDRVYWLEWKTGRVASVPKTGGTVTVLASGPKDPRGLAVGFGTAVWCEPGEGTVSKVVFDADAVGKAPAAAAASVPAKRAAFPPGKCKKDADCPGHAECNAFGECDYRGPAQWGR